WARKAWRPRLRRLRRTTMRCWARLPTSSSTCWCCCARAGWALWNWRRCWPGAGAERGSGRGDRGAHAVAAVGLGRVEGLVRGPERVVDVAGGIRRDRVHADAGRDAQLQPLRLARFVDQRLADVLGDRHRLVEAGAGQGRHELLAAEPGKDRVVRAQGLADAPGRAAQDLVADQVAVLVVDALEMVQVDHQQRQRAPRGPRLLQQPL